MPKQHPQTAYRKYAVSIGTVFENCDKRYFSIFLHKQRACLSILRMGGLFFCVPLLTAVRQSDMILVSEKKRFRPHKEGTVMEEKSSDRPQKAAWRCCRSRLHGLCGGRIALFVYASGHLELRGGRPRRLPGIPLLILSIGYWIAGIIARPAASRCSSRRKRWCSPSSATMQAP